MAYQISSRTLQAITNAMIDGMVIITAMTVPRSAI